MMGLNSSKTLRWDLLIAYHMEAAPLLSGILDTKVLGGCRTIDKGEIYRYKR